MKKKMKYGVTALLMLFTLAGLTQTKEIKKAIDLGKDQMGNYTYYNYVVSDVAAMPNKTEKECVEFSAFAGIFYKIIFCSIGLEDSVVFEVYNKPAADKTRKLVFSGVAGSNANSFEPSKATTYYIEYIIPPSLTDNKKPGKVVMVIGVREKDYESLSKK